MIHFKQKGTFSNTEKFLGNAQNPVKNSYLTKCGEEGLRALSTATPADTGMTAVSWSYKIVEDGKGVSLQFYNSNIQKGIPVAIIIQYGHATRNGGWVEGRNYINPAVRPVFDKLAEKVWMEVNRK